MQPEPMKSIIFYAIKVWKYKTNNLIKCTYLIGDLV